MDASLGQTPSFNREQSAAEGATPTAPGQNVRDKPSELYSDASGGGFAHTATLDSSGLEKQAGALLHGQMRAQELLAATEIPPAEGLRITRDAGEFHKAIETAKLASPHGAFVNLYSREDYEKMTLILTTDGMGGVAVKKTGEIVVLGDIVSVFKHPDSKVKDLIALVLPEAIKRGGTHLDCFAGQLPDRYAKHGFVPVAKVRFNDEFMPPDWDLERYKRPDIIFMVYDPQQDTAGAEKSLRALGKSTDDAIKELEYSTSYEEGQKVQATYAEKINKKS